MFHQGVDQQPPSLARKVPAIKIAFRVVPVFVVMVWLIASQLSGHDIFLVKQLPVLKLATFLEDDTSFVTLRVLALVYSAWDVKPFADELWKNLDDSLRHKVTSAWIGIESRPLEEGGVPLTPRRWNELERAVFRAELDAYYAHLYGLTRDELRYVLDPKDVFGTDFPSETFRVLKEKEERLYGEYRTRRLVLEAFDKLAESPRFRDEMPKRVSAFETPPKGGGAAAKV